MRKSATLEHNVNNKKVPSMQFGVQPNSDSRGPWVIGLSPEAGRGKLLHRHAAGETSPSEIPSIVQEVLRGPGQALDADTRRFMESRLGHDFSRVRVHSDSRAAQSASAVNSFAYTVGTDVVFGEGRYRPGTKTGRRLLAHELTHVVQQSRVSSEPQRVSEISKPSDGAEIEAERLAIESITQSPISEPAEPIGQPQSLRGKAYQQRARAIVSPRVLLRDSMPWPLNGYVINNSSKPVTVWSDSRQLYTIAARATSDRFTEDVDHIKDEKGQWYKIKSNTVTVDASGKVHGYECAVGNFGEDCPGLEKPERPLTPAITTGINSTSKVIAENQLKTGADKSAKSSALEKPQTPLTPAVTTRVDPKTRIIPKNQLKVTDPGESAFKGPIAEAVPDATLLSAFVKFTMPANKVFKDAWNAKVHTNAATRVTVFLAANELQVSFAPGIFIDAVWPAENMSLQYAGYEFKTGKAYAYASSEDGHGVFSVKGTVESTITEMIMDILKGTPVANKSYDPMTDKDPMKTLAYLQARFDALPSEAGSSTLGASELSKVEAGVKLKLKNPIKFDSQGSGIDIPGGAAIGITVSGTATVAQLQAAQTVGAAVNKANIQSVLLTSNSIMLLNKGKPVAKLNAARLERGGKVKVEELTLLGDAEAAESLEWLISALGNAFQAKSLGASTGLSLLIGAKNAETRIVRGLTKGMIEDALTQAITKAVVDNAKAIPGIDLAQALDVKK